MRFLCTYRIKDEQDNIILKSEIHEVNTKDILKGQIELLTKLSLEYNIPAHFIEREPEQVGILYINPKKLYCPTSLCDLDIEEWEKEQEDESIYPLQYP